MKTIYNKGFTLVELMIVVAIVAILASIAYPSYSNHVIKTRRTDAQGNLLALANAMERHYTQSNTYEGAANGGSDTGFPDASIYPSYSPLEGSDKYYKLEILSASSTGFTITATPINGQIGDGRLELDATGAKRWNSADDGSGTDSSWN